MSFLIATSVDWEHVAEFLSICKLSPYVVISCNVCPPTSLVEFTSTTKQRWRMKLLPTIWVKLGVKRKPQETSRRKKPTKKSRINWQVDKKNTNPTFHHNPRWPFSKKLGILWYARRKRPRLHMIWTNLTCWPMTSPQKTPPEKTWRPQMLENSCCFSRIWNLQMLHIDKKTHTCTFCMIFVA